jgi:hypothetical protein
MRVLITALAVEWELCGEDPVVFCYRIGVSLRESPSRNLPNNGFSISNAGRA